MSLRAARWTLWGVLAVVLLATWVVVRAQRPASPPPEPPPVLGQVPAFELTNRDGRTISSESLRGRVWVASFIFTRCALSCPRITSQMLRLGADLPEEPSVARVSVSVDPAYDTPDVLADYADAYSIRDPDWLFLTGSVEAVEALTVDGFKLPVVREPPPEARRPDEPILHSDRLVLVDGLGRIRGYYEPAVEEEYEKLLREIVGVVEETAEMASNPVSTDVCKREIEELHAFFGRWFRAELPDTDVAFARFQDALADGFTLIGPDAEQVGRAEITDRIRAAHGSRKTAGFRIWIEDVRQRAALDGHCLMSYQEWQRADGMTRVRLSSVLFRAARGAPNGVEWLHLHETWIPAAGGR